MEKRIIRNTVLLFFLLTFLTVQSNGQIQKENFWVTTTSNSLNITVHSNVQFARPELAIEIKSLPDENIFWKGKIYGKKENEDYRFSLNSIAPELWQPLNPKLYQLSLKLTDNDKEINQSKFRIGFRDFETKDGRIFLNGHPIFLRGIAINPPGRGIPKELEESREFALDYVRFMKNMNVNIIRIPDNESWYDVCDELGMMVFGGNYSESVDGETPPKNYDKGVEWYKVTKFQPIMHHPSLMIYALTNEVPYTEVKAQEWIDFLSYAHNKLKQWDHTRLYIGNAGYGYGQSGDICDLHRYWGWYYSSPFTFLNVRDYEKITFPEKVQPLTFTECVGNYTGPDGRYNLTPNHKNPVSQLNWTGHAPQREQQLLADEHQSWVFKQVTELLRRLRRINPESSGVFPFTIMFRNWHTVSNFIEMAPKPVTQQARVSYQPVLISWENWQPQVYAGAVLHPIAHVINDSEDFSALQNNKLVIRILDKANSIIFAETISLPDIEYYGIHSEKVQVKIPKNIFTGDYQLEGIVYSSEKEVSRNSTELFISGIKNKVSSTVEIPVYDPSGKTLFSLKELGYLVKKIDADEISNQTKTLIIGENATDKTLMTASNQLHQLMENGCRILVLRQDKEHRNFLNSMLPVPLNFPEMDIDDPEYPPPPRPSRNSFNINPERTDHLAFRGINRNELKVWSDYTGWDETKSGMPAIYPVTNGFTLQNKTDKKQVAILANYSVGLEGIALAELFEEQGSVLISGFDLVNRTGLDPVADQLLINLVDYCLRNQNHQIHPLIEAPILWGEYETEKGILDGITSGFMLNSNPKLTGSYEDLPIIVEKDGHMYAGAKWGWNNRAGKQYVPYGRRIFGPYHHRDFGGVPTPDDPESETGKAYFWCRVSEGIVSMKTLVWNPAEEPLKISIGINKKGVINEAIPAGEYKWFENRIADQESTLKIELEGDRRLVVLETHFSE